MVTQVAALSRLDPFVLLRKMIKVRKIYDKITVTVMTIQYIETFGPSELIIYIEQSRVNPLLRGHLWSKEKVAS